MAEYHMNIIFISVAKTESAVLKYMRENPQNKADAEF